MLGLGARSPMSAQTLTDSGATLLTPGTGTLTINTPGTYWLTSDMVVGGTGTNAIVITAGNVTLDLKGHTVLSASAPNSSNVSACGVYANNCANLTVRNGTIKGFLCGVRIDALTGGQESYDGSASFGHLLENLSVSNSGAIGIWLVGGSNIVRDCLITATGGTVVPGYTNSYGIYSAGPHDRVINCTVRDVFGNVAGSSAGYGIYFHPNTIGTFALQNRVNGMDYGVYFDTGAMGKYAKDLADASVPHPYNGGTDAGGNLPAMVTSALVASNQLNLPFSYQITASLSPTSFSATGLPPGLNVNAQTGLISGTPTQIGSFAVTLSAISAGGTGSATLSLTITPPPPPAISSATTVASQVNTAFSYQITASNSPASYGASGLPTGLSVNTATGVISGTSQSAGSYSVSLTATNAGGTGSATLTLVITTNPPTTFSFTLASGSYTSAGVYDSTNRLVRTLWRRVRYLSGNHLVVWDSLDDNNVAAPAGSYNFKLLTHNVSYAWDGVIGNNSLSFNGTINRNCTPDNVLGLAYDGGSHIYEAFGYNEGRYDIMRFGTANPLVPQNIVRNTLYTNFAFVATDGLRLYVADVGIPGDQGGADPTLSNHNTTFVTAYQIDETGYAATGAFTPYMFTNASAQQSLMFEVKTDQHPALVFPNCLDVDSHTGPNPQPLKRATGMAVQTAGNNILAVSHGDSAQTGSVAGQSVTNLVAGQDKISLFDKITGQPLGSIAVLNPQNIAFAPNGDLWITTGTTMAKQGPTLAKVSAASFSGLSAGSSLSPQIVVSAASKVLTQPLGISIASAGSVVLVADGGSNQQVLAFDANGNGSPSWSYGQNGGYSQTNGSLVTDDKFRFGDGVGIAALSDSSFWVGDGGCAHGGTNRLLHIPPGRSTTALEQIAYTSSGFTTATLASDPTRVFWNFLEYHVDYSQSLKPGNPGTNGSWKLIRNWIAGYDVKTFAGGPHTLVTLGGHVYGLLQIPNYPNDPVARFQLVEFTAGGLMRPTPSIFTSGYSNQNVNAYSLFDTGDSVSGTMLRYVDSSVDSSQRLWGQTFMGLDGSLNPQWGSPTLLASFPTSDPTNPQDGAGYPGPAGWQVPQADSSDFIVFDQSKSQGMHLGGIAPGGTFFRWKASPPVATDVPLDGLGSFDTGDGIKYCANRVMTSGHNILFGFQGEFWNNSEACQTMHFDDDGLFVGQFGTSGNMWSPLGAAVPGIAGNASCPSIIKNGFDTYLYSNDESAHGGIHRWHLLGLDGVNKSSTNFASGAPGAVTVSQPGPVTPSPAPSDVKATSSTGSVTLNWSPVANASSYNVRWIKSNGLTWPTGKGGPYANSINGVTTTTCQVANLTNDQQYLFVVTTVDASGKEGPPSSEVCSMPVDVSVPVHLLGVLETVSSVGDDYMAFDSSAIDRGAFSVQLHSMFSTLGTLYSTNFGSRGFSFFDYNNQNPNTPYSKLPSGYTISQGNGWGYTVVSGPQGSTLASYLNAGYKAIETNYTFKSCLIAGSTGNTISIAVPDAAWHCLTLVSPAVLTTTRTYRINLSPAAGQGGANSAGVTYTVDETTFNAPKGYDRCVQFAFKGSVTLTMTDIYPPDPGGGKNSKDGSATLSAIFIDDYPAQ